MKDILSKQREFFSTNETKTISFRKAMLQKLKASILLHEGEIYAALKQDLNKSETEAYLTEVQMVVSEIDVALKHLSSWQKPKRVATPISHFPAKSRIYREPFGIALVMSPWNYPFQLALAPVAGAISGGNCVVLKTSKNAPAVCNVIKKIIRHAFEEKFVCCVSDEYSYDEVLEQQYDIIFFTGSERVGKIVMEAASRHLTPVLLELGGKSPCIIEKTADLYIAAKRVAWGKFLNSGQTCVAPDYVLIEKSAEKEFVEILLIELERQYKTALENPDYPRIINLHHYNRLNSLIAGHKNKHGGACDDKTMQIEPTLFFDVSFDDEIMQEEIFGPILPIITYENLSDIVKKIKALPKPLALYMFSKDTAMIDAVINSISFGSGCINDTVMQLANHHLPFGGVSQSGMGNYHGKHSFDAFTREKGILFAKNYLDLPLRYPPYTQKKLNLIKKIMK